MMTRRNKGIKEISLEIYFTLNNHRNVKGVRRVRTDSDGTNRRQPVDQSNVLFVYAAGLFDSSLNDNGSVVCGA